MTDPVPVSRGSYCTRCGALIPLHGVQLYIDADHLCQNCASTSDSEHTKKVVESERNGPKIPVDFRQSRG